MNHLVFSIDIRADKNSIWHALWDENRYREWVGVFSAGSYAVTDHWKEGSTVHFLGPDQSGIYSIVEKHIPNQLMKFRHVGTVQEGREQAVDEETGKWSGATETYLLSEGEDAHTLTVGIDVMDEHLEFMQNTFPAALEIIRKNSS